MSARFVATVGNGRLLARIGADGSLIGLCAPQLDHELLEKPIHGVLEQGAGRRRRIGGRGWKHRREYVRGTNVLRVMSRHATGIKVERRLAAIGESLLVAFRCEGDCNVGWESGLANVLPQAGMPFDGAWPEGFDPPPLAGATRASIVARVPDLADRATIADLYARSVLVIAQHHDRSGSFAAGDTEDALLAHALDVCGERGAARAFFEWAAEHRGNGAVEPPSSPPTTGTGAALWAAWQDAVAGRRANAVAALQGAAARRSSLRLFVSGSGVDLAAHALLLLTVHALIPGTAPTDDGFFEHQASVQRARHARALYGGAFHSGMPEPGEGRLITEVRSDLDVTAVMLEVEGKHAAEFEPSPVTRGHPALWSGPVPPTEAGEVSRYRLRIHLRDPDATPMWASDTDPRPGGQEFAFEAAPPPPADWARDALCYHVMVDRFARAGESLPAPGDATALYGGTLDGIREHMDHIASLGCNVLWLSPVHQSPSHHGYDHEDFLIVEPRYGGDAALVRLVEAAHDRDMRVLLDFVPNHTGRGHHLFRDAIEKDGDAASYYRFWQWPHYYRCFSDVISLPELDTGDRNVQQQLVRAAQHWLTAYGADGVRCDHVAGVDPAFWVELRRGLRTIKPDALVLGEATGLPEWLARYAGRLDAIFDFDLAYYMRQALARGRMDAAGFATWLDEHDRAYPGLALANLLDNHDMNRFLWMAGGNMDRLKLAATLLLTLPGMPVIYYGTEVGLSQRFDGVIENAEARLPMLWGSDQNQDLLAHFQALGRMRRNSIALRQGDRRTVLADAEVFAYERRAGDERVVVALNFVEQPQRRELPGLEEPVELGPLGYSILGIDRFKAFSLKM
jgi:cyclomaltodextrinase / maltogenic alpha-amylase / neopullulanase